MKAKSPPRPGYCYRGRVPLAKVQEAVDLAAKTTILNASRVSGVSSATIRKAMIAQGIPRRRCGNLTHDEVERMGNLFVL